MSDPEPNTSQAQHPGARPSTFVTDIDQPQQLQTSTPAANPQVLSGSYSEQRKDRIS